MMLFELMLALTLFYTSVSTLPMMVYNNARFDPNNIQTQFINILPATTQNECVCQCLANSSCITATFIGRTQTCILFRANLLQGQLRIMLDNNASVIHFPNRSINTNPNNRPDIVEWLFDGNFNDVYGHYNGILVGNNTATWISPGYNGYGQAVYLSSENYSLVNNYLNLTGTSFTFSAWIWIPYSSSVGTNDYFILFGQCQNTVLNQCLHIGTMNNVLYFGFYNNDLPGNTQLNYNRWYHVAYVHDAFVSHQFVYLNGKQDANRTPTGFYIGNPNSSVIGTVPQIALWTAFRTGYIDKLTFVPRRKNDTELLNEATLVVYYPFDGTYTDLGPNQINNITQINTTFDISGRLNEALIIGQANSSYFQSRGFYYLCRSNYSYSFSMWIYLLGYGGTILQVSSPTNCRLSMVGFNSVNRLIVQAMGINGIYGSVLMNETMPLGRWIHISMTYSTSNGIQLFVNGTLTSSNRVSTDYLGGNGFCTITLGNDPVSNSCASNPVTLGPSQFRGKIDELKIFSRELSPTEIYQLALI